MTLPLMPKATAVWLIENTKLTFKQIADFCGLHHLEVKGIADGEVATSIIGINPITNGQITQENLRAAEADPKISLSLREETVQYLKINQRKTGTYTPVARRQDKPDAISWFIRNHPEVPESKIAKLIGTTKKTIESIREKSHWNSNNIRPRDPVLLGLCSQIELDNIIIKYKKPEEEA